MNIQGIFFFNMVKKCAFYFLALNYSIKMYCAACNLKLCKLSDDVGLIYTNFSICPKPSLLNRNSHVWCRALICFQTYDFWLSTFKFLLESILWFLSQSLPSFFQKRSPKIVAYIILHFKTHCQFSFTILWILHPYHPQLS